MSVRDEVKLKVYTDSNYARVMEDRKSTSGYVCLMSGAAVCWCSRKQEIVTLSSTEAEYVAATLCACHFVWMKGLMQELGSEIREAIGIWCDNSSTIKLSKNRVVASKSADQLADVLTKPMKMDLFEKIRDQLGVRDFGFVW
ncbi:hypothetical protein E3N88_07894 [Mikania micrantha]|uniref:Reverse transcriptase Ty1/copia-type domain-containing protein n=1 Tax=Mikania micrantha TaxID=192012 RepID=A0A5N6PEQ4_9ASTR|nr:hypothetical protein E3N88_07894 [Mikania micrantha]